MMIVFNRAHFYIKRPLILILLGLFWALMPAGTAISGDIKNGLSLTRIEKQWLAKHPIIHVHNEMSWAPINFSRFGRPSGFSIDIMNLIAEKTGLKVKYITGPSWNEFIDQIREKKLDVMLNIVNSEKRRTFLEFTDPYLEFSQALYTRKDFPRINSIDDLAGKRFAVPKGFYVEELLKNHPEVTLVSVTDTGEAIRAVSNGEADVLLDVMPVVNYLSRKMLVTNLKSGGILGFNENRVFRLSIGVRNDWKVLTGILQKGLASITESEFRVIQDRWFGSSGSSSARSITLSVEEQAWIAKHPVIRASSEPDYAPFDFTKDGKPVGFSIDYLNLIAERAGLKLEYVQDTWVNLIDKARRKELDLLHTVFLVPERQAFLKFTKPYKSVVNFIYAQKGESRIQQLADLSNMKVALPKGDSIAEQLPIMLPDAEIVYFDRYLDVLMAISLRQADATIMDSAVANYLIRENTLTNIQPIAKAKINPGDRDPRYRLAVRKDWPELHAILEKAIATISRDDLARLEARWFGLMKEWKLAAIELTAEESRWMKIHRVIRVHNEKDWPPFNYFEYGAPRGLSIDYMNLLAEKLGISVKYVTGLSRNEFLDQIRNREIDVMLNIVRKEDRENFIRFTPPYMRNPNVIVSLSDQPFKTLEQLDGKTVSIPKGFLHQEILARSYPGIAVMPVENQLSALKAVVFGKADATVGEKAVFEYLIERNLLTGLKISGEIDVGNPDLANLRIGVRDDWGLLHSVLTKAMADVTPLEMRSIQSKWLRPIGEDTKPMVDEWFSMSEEYLMPLIGVVVAVGAILLLTSWLVSRTRKREISELYSSKEFQRIGLLIIALSIGIILLLAAWRLVQFRYGVQEETENRLKEVLQSTHQSLKIWTEEKKNQVRAISGDPQFLQLIGEVIRSSYSRDMLLNNISLNRLQAYLHEGRGQLGNLAYYILSPDMTIIGAHDDRVLGNRLKLERSRKRILDSVFLGGYKTIPPFKSKLIRFKSGSSLENEEAMLMFAGPIKDDTGMVRAVFAIAYDPTSTLSRISRSGRTGMSGETYLFDNEAVLLTETRFRGALQNIGLLVPGQSSVLNIKLLNPGKPLTSENANSFDRKSAQLTYMAVQATGFRDGSNIDGYRDYRGIEVAGTWLWDSELNMGITTEIDLAEAYSRYMTMRNTLMFTLGVAVLIALTLTGFSLWIGQNANRSLIKARDHLEVRVEERTAELARLEKRFRDLLESAPDSMIIVNEKGIITIVNEQTEELFGYSRDELVGQPIEFVVPHRFRGDHPDKRNEFIAASMKSLVKITRELIGLKKNGDEFPADISLNPLQTEEGLLVSAAVRDISERIEAQNALLESEERNRLVLDSVGEGIFGVNLDGEIMFINPAACQMLGYTGDELLGEKIHDLVHHTRKDGSHYPVDECPMKKAYVEGNTYSIDDEILWKKNGTPIDVYYTSTPILKDNQIEGAVITFRDVTDKRHAEEELKASENRFRGYFEYGQVGMSVTHPDKGWQEVNKRFLDMLGYTLEELKSLTWADLTYEEDLATDLESYQKIMAGEINNYSMDKRFVRKDGDLVFVNLSVACTRDEEGRVEKLLASMLDITEAKKNEAELQQRFDELERFRRLATGRELKMIALKAEINDLLTDKGIAPKYKIHKSGKGDDKQS